MRTVAKNETAALPACGNHAPFVSNERFCHDGDCEPGLWYDCNRADSQHPASLAAYRLNLYHIRLWRNSSCTLWVRFDERAEDIGSLRIMDQKGIMDRASSLSFLLCDSADLHRHPNLFR